MIFNKPKFWDKSNFTLWPYLLLPFSLIINLINFFRQKTIQQNKIEIPIICVGNLYLGGTGKTPLSIELHKILKNLKKKPAFIKKKIRK